ncbi:MAG: hypothetical protein ACRENG_06225, partial [bacterium]
SKSTSPGRRIITRTAPGSLAPMAISSYAATPSFCSAENRREWLIEGASGKTAYPQWYGRLFREFVHKIETASYSTELLEEAATALRYAELCYRSAKTGKTYRFSDEKA